METRLFPKASSSRRLPLSSSPSERPRWRTPSPMTASLVPPPIVPAAVTPAASASLLAHSVVVSPTSQLQDRQSELEANIQFLLDAQAEGLVKGLGDGQQDDQTSNGSTTPTAQSVMSATSRQQRRLSRRKPGLRSARKGIYNAMVALSSLKDDELADINDDVRQKEQNLAQIAEWNKKREGLHEAAKGVDADEEAIRAQRLRQEANVLQDEIGRIELQLGDLKARHRKLMRQATAVENSVQAKLASYTSSLHLLDEETRKFLSLHDTQSTPQDGRTSMWQLPPKRRTLDMAEERWNEERRSAMQHREGVEHEKAALEEGATIWKDIVSQVTEFERRLRSEVAELSTPSTAAPQKLAVLIEDMRQLTQFLESRFDLVKDRTWNLLIAAIGAEVDALKKGRQMLEAALNPSAEPEMDALPNDDLSPSPGEEIHNLDKSFETARRRLSNGADSDPDPELMFSKNDTDTE